MPNRDTKRNDGKKAAVKGLAAKPPVTRIAKKSGSGNKAQTTQPHVVVRNARTGRLLVGGTDERRLVNNHADIQVKSASVKPKHISESLIKDLMKMMKVA